MVDNNFLTIFINLRILWKAFSTRMRTLGLTLQAAKLTLITIFVLKKFLIPHCLIDGPAKSFLPPYAPAWIRTHKRPYWISLDQFALLKNVGFSQLWLYGEKEFKLIEKR